MRCNSGFLRWPPLLVIIGSCLYLLLTFNTVNSSPVHQRLARMIRDQESEQIVTEQNGSMNYQYATKKETTEKCLHDGVLMPKNDATCDSKPGCRVIQKTGECCPEFQCQCERDGKIYATGEKLVDPETPCRVCYCQGGEFICNNVTCYIRNDCEPKYIAGRCCPEYDNCPPLEHVKVGPTEMMLVTEAAESTPSTTHHPIIEDSRETSTTVRSTILYPLPNANQLGIKIKEITKVEEIRITNPPKIDSLPTAKTHISQDTTTSEPSLSTTSTSPVASTELNEINRLEDVDDQEGVEYSKDTNKRQTAIEETLEDKLTEEGNFSDNSTNDEEVFISSSSTATPEKLYPSVVQMGDRVVIVDHNGKNKPITIIGVEGLQLGGEDLDHIELSSTQRSTSDFVSISSSGDDSTNEIFDLESSGGTTEWPGIEQQRFEIEDHQGSPSSNIYMIASTPLVESSGENLLVLVNSSLTDEDSEVGYDTIFYTPAPEVSSNETETFDTTYFGGEESTENDTTENWLNARGFSVTSEEDQQQMGTSPSTPSEEVMNQENPRPDETFIEEDELANHELINPEYPPLPEDISLYGREHGSAPFADEEIDQQQSRTHHESSSSLMMDSSTEKINSLGVEKSENDTADEQTSTESQKKSNQGVIVIAEEISSPESLQTPPHNPKDDAESLKYQKNPNPVDEETSLQVEDNRSSLSDTTHSAYRRVKKYF